MGNWTRLLLGVGWIQIAVGAILFAASTSIVQAGDQACCQVNSEDRNCYDDIIGSGLTCPPGNGLGTGTTCADDCPCGDTCGTCVGKQAGNLSTIEIQLAEPPVFNGTNTTYRYRVCQVAGHAISNFVVGLPELCCSRVVSATGARTTGTCAVDPTTGMFGIKFETNNGVPECEGDCGTEGTVFTIVMSGNATSPGCIKMAHKADGNENTATVCIVGPTETCSGACTSDTHCNDGIPCTIDDCDPSHPDADNQGCVYLPDDALCNDANPCTDDRCVAGEGCVFTPDNTNSCTNGLFCDGPEVCVDGKCQSTTPPCEDGVACTRNECDEQKDVCTYVPDDSLCSNGEFCDGAETCHPISGCQPGTPVDCGHLDGVCAVGQCNEQTDSCEASPTNENGPCDDGFFCTEGDVCVEGQCQGSPVVCNDHIGCTNDFCDEALNACVYNENDSKCDNGMFCDGRELCEPGDPAADPLTGCIPGSEDCSPCPCNEDLDTCVCDCPANPCPPDNQCSRFECVEGSCVPENFPPGQSCDDDGVACTVDACDGNGNCVHTPDDSLCTPDENPCTDTVCHPTAGCMHVNDDTNGCDDGQFCTIEDRCVAGECIGVPNPCDDGVACTVDTCDEDADQCVHSPDHGVCPPSTSPCLSYVCDLILGCIPVFHDGVSCDDGDACTTGDECVAGACTGQPNNCDDGVACTLDSCDPATGLCQHVPLHIQCDDGLPCTDDLCVVGVGCVSTPDDTNSCSDGLFCNGLEACVAGVCKPGSNPCGDGVDCTDDVCSESKKMCIYVPNDEFCSDGVFCNGVEICHRKKGCQAGPPPVCDDQNLCTRDECDPVTDQCKFTADVICDDGLFCNGVETCDPEQGCQPGTEPDCDDQIDCTHDLCNPDLNACEHIPDHAFCQNGLHCDGQEICDPLLGCVDGPDPDCDDGVECTIDSCDEDNDTCLHVPDPNVCGFDGLFCNGEETCDPKLGCLPGTPPCTGGLLCDESNDVCVNCIIDDDCSHIPFCVGTGDCINGTCDMTPPDCDDGVECTVDVCDPTLDKCVNTPDDSLCSNGLFCDGAETCDPLTGCLPGTIVLCDDQVACTNDECDETIDQCTFTPKDSHCDDGLFCNGFEVCHPTKGCLVGTPPMCDDGAVCSEDSCNEVTDQCDNICDVPQITCTNQQFECDSVIEFIEPVVDDNCTVNPVATCTETETPGKLPQERTITRECGFTNDCGNSASCQQVVDVVDTTPPDVTCPPDKVFECDAIGDFGEPIVSDNCDPDPEVIVTTETIEGDCTPPNTAGISPPPKLIMTNTYTVSDGLAANVATGDTTGNTAQCTQRIEIIDTHSPLFVTCPTSVPGCPGEALDFTPPSCLDSCGECSVVCVRSDGRELGALVPFAPLSISCTAYDECENPSSACNFDVDTQDCDMSIPTVSHWGLVVLTLLLMIGAKIRFSREVAAG